MTTIEERKKNYEERMEEHEKQKISAVVFRNCGFSCEEISHMMNVSESTVRALLKEAEYKEENN